MRRIPAALGGATLLACAPLELFAAKSPYSVGANVMVSRENQAFAHIHPTIVADPNNASRLLACAGGYRGDGSGAASMAYASLDGGKTWKLTFADRTGYWQHLPGCAYESNGTAYMLSLPLDTSEVLKVLRSTDGGQTWSAPAMITHANSMPSLALDSTGGAYSGRTYVAVSGYISRDGVAGPEPHSPVMLLASADGGATFGKPTVRIADPRAAHGSTMGGVAVLLDGTVLVTFTDWLASSKPSAKAVLSTDGGETLQPAITVSPTGSDPILPVVDRSEGPFRGRVYVTWIDDALGRYQIYLSYSVDNGRTWSSPRVLNDDIEWPRQADGSRGPMHMLPRVAVNKDGVVGVSWYDGRHVRPEDAWRGQESLHRRFRASLDGGETWLPSVQISEKPRKAGLDAKWWLNGYVGAEGTARGDPVITRIILMTQPSTGHTSGLTADANGVFHSLWVDDREGWLQLWTAPITVAGNP